MTRDPRRPRMVRRPRRPVAAAVLRRRRVDRPHDTAHLARPRRVHDRPGQRAERGDAGRLGAARRPGPGPGATEARVGSVGAGRRWDPAGLGRRVAQAWQSRTGVLPDGDVLAEWWRRLIARIIDYANRKRPGRHRGDPVARRSVRRDAPLPRRGGGRRVVRGGPARHGGRSPSTSPRRSCPCRSPASSSPWSTRCLPDLAGGDPGEDAARHHGATGRGARADRGRDRPGAPAISVLASSAWR